MSRVFFDTNVLVYVYDGRDKLKQAVATALVAKNIDDDCVVSPQVVHEFCNVMLTKKGVTMQPDDLEAVLKNVFDLMLRPISGIDWYRRAIKLYTTHSLSFYDALIVQAAIDLDCSVLYSEDLQDGQKFGGLTIHNPFK